MLLIGLHVWLLGVLTLSHVDRVGSVDTHGGLALCHGDRRNLHGALKLSVWKCWVELLWLGLARALLTHLIHHVHLGWSHAVHGVVHVVWHAALKALQLLLPCGRHDDEFLLDLREVLFLGSGGHEVLRFKLEGGSHRLDLWDIGLEEAVLGEELQSELAALVGRRRLLPSCWDLALLLLDAIVLDKVVNAGGGATLLHAVLLHVWVVHGDAQRVRDALAGRQAGGAVSSRHGGAVPQRCREEQHSCRTRTGVMRQTAGGGMGTGVE